MPSISFKYGNKSGNKPPRVGIVSISDPAQDFSWSLPQGCDPELQKLARSVEACGALNQYHHPAPHVWRNALRELRDISRLCDFILISGGNQQDQACIEKAIKQIGRFTISVGFAFPYMQASLGSIDVDTHGRKRAIPFLILPGNSSWNRRLFETIAVPAIRSLCGLPNSVNLKQLTPAHFP